MGNETFYGDDNPRVFFPAFGLPAPPTLILLPILNIQAARPQISLPRRRLEYCKLRQALSFVTTGFSCVTTDFSALNSNWGKRT